MKKTSYLKIYSILNPKNRPDEGSTYMFMIVEYLIKCPTERPSNLIREKKSVLNNLYLNFYFRYFISRNHQKYNTITYFIKIERKIVTFLPMFSTLCFKRS